MMSHQQVQMDLILMQGIWHSVLNMQNQSILLQLGSSSSMPQRPRLLSRVSQRGRQILNLESGRWRLSIIIFLETGTIQLTATILPSTDCQDI
ncbi:non-structural protein [Snowshoe hare virus]|uniref:Non-structural protein NS-S n=2 Tax=Bunyavirus snowshoe hare TaxID=11580 RepID=NSS_BUNSH|nr:non-structural protein [Snowshoe hare virus]P03514.1 RecName: Full=Non-structural protein NS-S [Snowshoe hare virus]ABX89408.1 non-structural protein [Snowshoe hare virus]AIL54637.1 nonstructural protein [Snowshoe hare virus]AIL54639.1 nonstructural protein [Snowshoe hare virus]